MLGRRRLTVMGARALAALALLAGCSSSQSDGAQVDSCYWSVRRAPRDCRSCVDASCGAFERSYCGAESSSPELVTGLLDQIDRCLLINCNAPCTTGEGELTNARVACRFDDQFECATWIVATIQDKSLRESTCTASATLVDACPTDGLIGCCTAPNSTTTECYYPGRAVDPTELDCKNSSNGVWTTTPP